MSSRPMSGCTGRHGFRTKRTSQRLAMEIVSCFAPTMPERSPPTPIFKVPPRLAILRLRPLHQKAITIINCYSLTSAADDSKLDAFYEDLEEVIRKENSIYNCVDHIQTVSRVIEVCREYPLPLILTFVDYEEAFDSVETNAILSALVD
ncbi:unnamed protein product [Strongylus vulgaris]|uniref:Reverse transcriptase domain-containing protein n=1 Tax=Strongylus vulgaris TaxID=40348 RepID=A0A3P7J8M2_STRVU|nr:unnamed protein product [Strongylus vulgaris]